MRKGKNQDPLLLAVAHGDESAFETLFTKFQARLHRFAYSYMKSKILADEIVMDVFLKLWQRREIIIEIKNIETYLFVSVRNLAFTALKKEKKLDFDELEQPYVELARYTTTPETSIITQENLDAINQAIETLPPKCKMIFKLIREEGFNKKDASEILNLSVKTIDNQISIAVKKIAEVLNIDLSLKDYSSYIQSFLLSM